jgi:hypothetical protein
MGPESITTIVSMDSGLAPLARPGMTVNLWRDQCKHDFAFSRRRCVRALQRPHPRNRRVQERPGIADTHGPRAAKKHAAEPQVQPITGLPCAMALRLIRALPRDRLSCPCRPRARQERRGLGISTGMPGPHDFAVRIAAVRPTTSTRPPHPAPDVRDDAYAPLR